MVKIFDDGILEATLFPSNYVFMAWLQNKRGKLQKTLVKDFKIVEKIIKDKGYKGWFTFSEGDHPIMHKLLGKYGAIRVNIDSKNNHWFIKQV